MERVVDVVSDGEIVAALDDGAAVGATLRAGNAEGETVDERLQVCAVGERLGEVDLHRVVVIHAVAVALRPGDVDALVGAASLNGAHQLGDVGRRRVEGYVAHGRGFVQADGDVGCSAGRDVVVAETPFFLVGQVDRGDAGGLAPSLGERGVIGVVAIDVGEVLARITHAVLIGIDKGFEAGAVAVGLTGRAVVIAGVAVGNMEPDVFDRLVGAENQLIARSAGGVAVGRGEKNGAARRCRVIVEDLREGLVERRGGVGVAVEVGAAAEDVEALAQTSLRGPRP